MHKSKLVVVLLNDTNADKTVRVVFIVIIIPLIYLQAQN